MNREKPQQGILLILIGFWITSIGPLLFALRPIVGSDLVMLLTYTTWTYFAGVVVTLFGQMHCSRFGPPSEQKKLRWAIGLNVFSLATFFIVRNASYVNWVFLLSLVRWFLSGVGYYLFLSYMHPFARSISAKKAEKHLERSLFWYRLVLLKILALIAIQYLAYQGSEWASDFLAAIHNPSLFFGELPFPEIVIQYARAGAVLKLGLLVISIYAFSRILGEMQQASQSLPALEPSFSRG